MRREKEVKGDVWISATFDKTASHQEERPARTARMNLELEELNEGVGAAQINLGVMARKSI